MLTKVYETIMPTLREHERKRKMPVADSITVYLYNKTSANLALTV